MLDTENHNRLKETHDAALASIVELVGALTAAEESENETAVDEAREAIHFDALSVEVRDGWRLLDRETEGPEEYRLLLGTGGPAVRIVGELNQYCEPESAHLEVQDWFMPWTRFEHDCASHLIAYARVFYFGEG